MGRVDRLTLGGTMAVAVAVALLAAAAPAHASGNDVLVSRAAVVTALISIQDLAPPSCDGMALAHLVTAADLHGAKIQGTNGNDLILGTAGRDRIDAKNGGDCLVGGAGADDLDGGGGRDVCLTGGDPGDVTSRCEA